MLIYNVFFFLKNLSQSNTKNKKNPCIVQNQMRGNQIRGRQAWSIRILSYTIDNVVHDKMFNLKSNADAIFTAYFELGSRTPLLQTHVTPLRYTHLLIRLEYHTLCASDSSQAWKSTTYAYDVSYSHKSFNYRHGFGLSIIFVKCLRHLKGFVFNLRVNNLLNTYSAELGIIVSSR